MEIATDCYRRSLPHIAAYDRSLFVTFVTKGRRQLPPCARNVVLARCVFGHGTYYWLHVVVVMPEHVHLILTIPRSRNGLRWQQVMKGIKGTSAREVKRLLRWDGNVWQPESFDRVIRRDERDVFTYIRENPVRRGLVQRADDYWWTWEAWRYHTRAQTGMSALHEWPPEASIPTTYPPR
jgi:putative transposase